MEFSKKSAQPPRPPTTVGLRDAGRASCWWGRQLSREKLETHNSGIGRGKKAGLTDFHLLYLKMCLVGIWVRTCVRSMIWRLFFLNPICFKYAFQLTFKKESLWKTNKFPCQKIHSSTIPCINKTTGIIQMPLRATASNRDKMVINWKFVLARGSYQV